MAQKTTVESYCDKGRPGHETTDVETVRFSWQSVSYEIDLCYDPHYLRYTEAFAKLIDGAREVKSPGGRPTAKRTMRSVFEREVDQEIRRLAKRDNAGVSDRGRLPSKIVSYYDAEARDNVKAARAERRRR